MSRLFGLIDRALYGNRKTVTFSYPAPTESYFPGSPVAIPTTEPGVSQIILTVTSGMLPTINVPGLFFLFQPHMLAGMQNTTAGSINLYMRVIKNGVSQGTMGPTSVGANLYSTAYSYAWMTVVPGDVIEFRLWASLIGINLIYSGLMIHPWSINLSTKINYADNIVVALPASASFVQGLAPAKVTGSFIGLSLYACNNGLAAGMQMDEAVTYTLTGYRLDPSIHGFYPSNTTFSYVPSHQLGQVTHAGYMPYYYGLPKITSIAWTPLQI